MSGARLSRLFFTLRHLRSEQFIYRIYYRFGRTIVRRRAMAALGAIVRREWLAPWAAPATARPSLLALGIFFLLGERGEVQSKADWNSAKKTKLWLYNLHYFDDLNAHDSEEREDWHRWLIDRWIEDNPPLEGNGWEPYPLALRTVNLVKWLSRSDHVEERWLSSLARQAQALFAQEERHLLANHLFVDAKAMVFAGAFFDGIAGDRWLSRGLRVLDEEMGEQFLPDGGNYELSPMYHASLLWDVCDLIRLGEVSGIPSILERIESWREVLKRGLMWLQGMCHPDGQISFFNDAAFEIAPTLDELEAYARNLGCRVPNRSGPESGARLFEDTGYAVIDWRDGARAILDLAEVGPDYQPGHAHADSLSYEWSVFGQRVLVNSGTSQYGVDAERQRQRGTRAHNTVEINGVDSSEVWAGFRVARRARPRDRSVVIDGERTVVTCSQDGYLRLRGRVVHRRQWETAPGRLCVSDFISGCFVSAVNRLYLHPDVRVSPEGVLVLRDGRCVNFSVRGGTWKVRSATWHPAFGSSIPSTCIEISISEADSAVEFTWG